MRPELEAYDRVIADGGTPAQALGAASQVMNLPIVEAFNVLLGDDSLRFVAIDRPGNKNSEGRPLVRVRDADGDAVVDGWLVKR